MSQEEDVALTKAQLARIEKNRQRALILKQTRLIPHPYAKGEKIAVEKTTIKIGASKYKDTGGGFLIEDDSDKPQKEYPIVEQPPPICEDDRPTCEECEKTFGASWLFDTFDLPVCDLCKDEEKHALITKTEAQKEYLLKDCDLDKREPILKFITRKNPHNSHWGQMKLYLQLQIEKRALEVWGSEENLQAELEKREEKRVVAKAKKYQKTMTNLRMNVRSSLFDKTKSASHVHEWGPETYNEDDDDYTHQCKTCGFKETFEKM